MGAPHVIKRLQALQGQREEEQTRRLTGLAVQQGNRAVAEAKSLLDKLTTRGDLLTHNGSAYTRLAVGTSGKYLRSDGTDPGWSGLFAADLSGQVAPANGGTGTANTGNLAWPSEGGTAALLGAANVFTQLQTMPLIKIGATIPSLPTGTAVQLGLYQGVFQQWGIYAWSLRQGMLSGGSGYIGQGIETSGNSYLAKTGNNSIVNHLINEWSYSGWWVLKGQSYAADGTTLAPIQAIAVHGPTGNVYTNQRFIANTIETAAGSKWKLAGYTADAVDHASNGYVTVTIDEVSYKLMTRA